MLFFFIAEVIENSLMTFSYVLVDTKIIMDIPIEGISIKTQIDNLVNRGMAGYMYLGYGYVNMKHSK